MNEMENEKLKLLLTDDFLSKLLEVYYAILETSYCHDDYEVMHFVNFCFTIAGKKTPNDLW